MAQVVKDVVAEMEDLKAVVLSFKKYPVGSAPDLNRIRVWVESAVKEMKYMVRSIEFPVDTHPVPPKPTLETEPALIIPYINQLIDVFVSDFDVCKMVANSVYPPSAQDSVYFFRRRMDNFRSRTLKEVDGIVCAERRMMKAEEVHVQIWKVKGIEVDLMMRLVDSLRTNPNHHESVEKLKRIQRCLCEVINSGRDFISAHSFVPQPESFPLGQVAHVSNPVEQASVKSLIRQLAGDGVDLVHLVSCCLDALRDCDFTRLWMKDLKDISDFVTTIEAALAKTAVEEGAEYPVIENY